MARGTAERVVDAVDLRLASLVPDIAYWMENPEQLRVLRIGYLLGFGDARQDPDALGIEADELRAFPIDRLQRLQDRASGLD